MGKQSLQHLHWMKITHLLKSCIYLSCLPCVSPPSSCQKIVVNYVTATVWKNTVRRGTSDKLDIALPHLLRNAAKQRNKETKQKNAWSILCIFSKLSVSYVSMISMIFPAVTSLILYLIQRNIGDRQIVHSDTQLSITARAQGAVKGHFHFEKVP